MTRKRRRLYFVLLGLLGLGAGAALVLTAFQDNIVFFYSPKDLAEKPVCEQRCRIGGLVAAGSLVKEGHNISFDLTDAVQTVNVKYVGILPDLFREGQGVVAEGRMNSGVFMASNVLAKHDENYMPPEVAKALKESGHWKEGEAPPAGMKNTGMNNN
ncbi:MAG: cytochrome c maturation protein CcmE [Rhodospirillaceae bacterium]